MRDRHVTYRFIFLLKVAVADGKFVEFSWDGTNGKCVEFFGGMGMGIVV